MTSTAATGAEVANALRRAGAVNPVFALGTGPHPTSGWPAAHDLCVTGTAATALVAAVGDRLGAAPPRVAASLAVLGYSSRLVAPAAAALVADRLLLDLDPPAVRWRYASGDGFRLGLPAPSGRHLPDGEPVGGALARRWWGGIVDGHLRGLVTAVRTVTPVAAGLLWGNIASSLAGALRILALRGVAPLTACRDAAQTLLAYGPLADTGHLSVHKGQLFFVRRSCCLYYLLPGGGKCGDCALVDDADRTRQWDRTVGA